MKSRSTRIFSGLAAAVLSLALFAPPALAEETAAQAPTTSAATTTAQPASTSAAVPTESEPPAAPETSPVAPTTGAQSAPTEPTVTSAESTVTPPQTATTSAPAKAEVTAAAETTAPTPTVWAPPFPVAPCAAKTNLPALCVTLEDAAATNNTQSYLDASKEHELASAIDLVDPANDANNISSTGKNPSEIKGRGNFTWTLAKKPYQIKFDAKTSVLGMTAAKKWVLLANHADPSLLRNAAALSLGQDIGLTDSPEFKFVDLFINGSYRGNYLVTEKVEIGTGRVPITSTQGVLVELDNNYWAAEPYFATMPSGSHVVLKDAKGSGGVPDPVDSGTQTALSPDVQAGWDAVVSKLKQVDTLLSAPSTTTGKADWAAISALIDVDSFIKYYWVQELAENPEVVKSSVFFWYDPAVDTKLHAGPIWDFDSGLKNYTTAREDLGGQADSDYVKNAMYLRLGFASGSLNPWYARLYRNEEFAARANAVFGGTVSDALDRLTPRLSELSTSITASAGANFAKWTNVLGQPSPMSANRVFATTWSAEAQRLRTFVSDRSTFLKSTNGTGMPLLQGAGNLKGVGWNLATVQTGQFIGTTGMSQRLNAFRLNVSGPVAGGVTANVHVAGVGWLGYKTAAGNNVTPWTSWPQQGTTAGNNIEAVQFQLTGALASSYSIQYRAHVATLGWQPWQSSGATAGTTGRSLPVEAIQLRLVKRATPAAGASHTSYSAQVQNIGWMASVQDGATAGTTGRSLRMEALKLQVTGGQYAGSVVYRAHVQNVGWQASVSDGAIAGTVGRGLRMEAVQINLTGDLAAHYTIRYRAYVQGVGWQAWVTDKQTAGTTGQALRVEAIQIALVAK